VRLAVGCVATSLFVAAVLWLQWLDVWRTRLDDAGPVYLLYNALRVAVVAGLGRALWYLGRLVLGRTSDDEIARFFAGAAAAVLALFGLGWLGLYHLVVLLPLTALLLLASFRGPGPRVPRPHPAWLPVGLTLAYLLFSKGIYPDIYTNDTMGHYLPYYRAVVERGGIWPNEFFLHFYYSKGAGLFFLAIALTDLQGPQLVSYLMLVWASFALYALARAASRSDWLAGLAVLLALLSPISRLEFQKSHMVVGAFVLFLVYAASLAAPALRRASALVAAAAVIVSPLAAAVVVPLLAVEALLGRLVLARRDWRAPLGIAGLTAAVVGAVLVANYAISGVVEMTPLTLIRYRADALVSRWWSPLALVAQMEWNALDNVYFDLATMLRPQISGLSDVTIIGVTALACLALVQLWRRSAADPAALRLIALAAPAVVVALVVIAGKQLVVQTSLTRFTTFVWLCVGFLFVFLIVWIRTAVPARAAWPAVTLLLVGGLIVTAANVARVVSDDRRDKRLDFAWGGASYRAAYGGWIYEPCLRVREIVPPERGVAFLNFLPGCYVLPSARFQRPLMNDYTPLFADVILGQPAAAAAALASVWVDYAFVDLGRPLVLEAFTPAFAPNALRDRATVVWQEGDVYLLALHPRPAGGLDSVFADRYAAKRAAEEGGSWAALYRRLSASTSAP